MAEPLSRPTPGQRRALQVLGHLFLRMGQFQRARKLALALLALDPADLWARRCLAVAWLELGDPERALALCHFRHASAFPLTAGMKGDTLILLTRLPERQVTAALLEDAVMELARVMNHLQGA